MGSRVDQDGTTFISSGVMTLEDKRQDSKLGSTLMNQWLVDYA